MGLSSTSTGKHVTKNDFIKNQTPENQPIIALAGNPNVGKSTVFNSLTGMHQHTGNWPGKTVENARGSYTYKNKTYALIDIPGAYSLMAHSKEEEVARDFICFGKKDAVIIVCDATCLLRNFNLVLQTLEATQNVIVCINLMDEAEKKGIDIHMRLLEERLGTPCVTTCARNQKGLNDLLEKVHKTVFSKKKKRSPITPLYRPEIEAIIKPLASCIETVTTKVNARWAALRLLEQNASLSASLDAHLGFSFKEHETLQVPLKEAKALLEKSFPTLSDFHDALVFDLYKEAERILCDVVSYENPSYREKTLKIDRFLTRKATGIPVMLLLLLFVLWITLSGANYPSRLLSDLLFRFQDVLLSVFHSLGVPTFLTNPLILGVYRVLAWVVSVMLPPMAIFFPLFTFLEDLGYLPRIAFNLDHQFKKCSSCGKQALTMCMGFGCNAAGVIGCRIIDSPRERLIAVLTNSFVPCNGRFPTLIAIISMFFIGTAGGFFSSAFAAMFLTAVIFLGILFTFWVSKFLSKTILKGLPSSFILELPPYRKPQIGKVLVRSVFDRTLFVLGRAVTVSAPAGLLIYALANISFQDASLLSHIAAFFDPFARALGLDGVILMAFILGFPANEIVIPIAIMTYLSTGTITEFEHISDLYALLVQNGWTLHTALSAMIFTLFHFPCSTTLISIKKETGSLKWTILAFLLPTLCGMTLCFLITQVKNIILLF